MSAIDKVLDLLEVILEQRKDVSIAEMSRLAHLDSSTAHRIASRLLQRGYLTQKSHRGNYFLSMKFLDYANVIRSSIRIADIALPFMDQLTKETRETVSLSILNGLQAVRIERTISEHFLNVSPPIGGIIPLYCTGEGKVLLASMEQDALNNYFSKVKLTKETVNTVTDIKKLKIELGEIRLKGIAFDNEERAIGTVSIAAPIKNENGVVAAIAILIPTPRYNDNRLAVLEKQIKTCTLNISRQIGFTG
jgi:IclR family transcriptional regulator, KDG regulon repressor